MTAKTPRIYALPLLPKLFTGTGLAFAAVLGVLPLINADADVQPFLFHASILALVLQGLGLLVGLALGGRGVCGWRVMRVGRWGGLALTVGLFWSQGWGAGTVPLLSAGLVLAFLLSAWSGALSELALGVTVAVVAFGIGHPLILPSLVALALGLNTLINVVRGGVWLLLNIEGSPKDIAIVAAVGGFFAPTVMLLGGTLGHDSALLSSAVITQFLGYLAARWVSRTLSAQAGARHA